MLSNINEEQAKQLERYIKAVMPDVEIGGETTKRKFQVGDLITFANNGHLSCDKPFLRGKKTALTPLSAVYRVVEYSKTNKKEFSMQEVALGQDAIDDISLCSEIHQGQEESGYQKITNMKGLILCEISKTP